MRDEWPRDPFEALADVFASLTAATPGFSQARVGRPGALACTVSAIPMGAFNRVMGVRLTDAEADDAIEAVKAAHAQANVPGSWWLDPGATPARLPEALERHGYRSEGTVPAMAIQLSGLPPVHLPAGAALSWVGSQDEMRAAQRTVGRGFGMPPDFVEQLAERLASMGDEPDSPIRVVVVTLDGVPMASAMAATVGDVVGVYSVTTLPEARGKGLGSAATLAVLHDASARGALMGVLESSEMGFPVYVRMGFRHVGDFRMFASG